MQLLSRASELGRVTGVAALEKRSYRLASWLELLRSATKTRSPRITSTVGREYLNPFSFVKFFPKGFRRTGPIPRPSGKLSDAARKKLDNVFRDWVKKNPPGQRPTSGGLGRRW